MIDLGTFGGSLGNSVAINDSGTVVGWANYPGDQIFHAFLWKNGNKRDLGTLPGDSDSFVSDINATEQVVGISVPDFDFSRARAFLWEGGGPMVDLNTLIPPNPGLQFATFPPNINDRGEIAIEGILNGNTHAFVLIPDDDNASGVDATQVSAGLDQSLPAVSKGPVTPKRVPTFVTRPTHHSRGFGSKPRK